MYGSYCLALPCDDYCHVQAGDTFNTNGVQTTPTLTFSHPNYEESWHTLITNLQFNNIGLLLQLNNTILKPQHNWLLYNTQRRLFRRLANASN